MRFKIDIVGETTFYFGSTIVEAPDRRALKGISDEFFADLIPEEYQQEAKDDVYASTEYRVESIQPLPENNQEEADAYFVQGQILTAEQYADYLSGIAEEPPPNQLVLPCCSGK